MLPQLQKLYRGSNRQGRTMFGQNNHVQDPHLTTQELLNYHKLANEGRIEDITAHIRQKRQGNLGSLKTKHTNSISCRPPQVFMERCSFQKTFRVSKQVSNW